jgi:hypothetical protein
VDVAGAAAASAAGAGGSGSRELAPPAPTPLLPFPAAGHAAARGEGGALMQRAKRRRVDSLLLASGVWASQLAAQIGEALGLAAIKDRQWSIQETSAAAGKGLHEGFDWLANAIQASPAK